MATWVLGLIESFPLAAFGLADVGNRSGFKFARYT